MSKVDANGVQHNANPLWSRIACPLGGALVGIALVHTFLSSPIWLLGILLGVALFGAGMYPSSYAAYWRTVERHNRQVRQERLL